MDRLNLATRIFNPFEINKARYILQELFQILTDMKLVGEIILKIRFIFSLIYYNTIAVYIWKIVSKGVKRKENGNKIE